MIKNRINEKIQELILKMRYRRIPAYIHIPKTGGTYLAQLESNRNAVVWPLKYLGHTCIITTKNNKAKIYPPGIGFLPNYITPKKNIKNYFITTTVRNIFSWLVSYSAHAGGFNPKYHDPDHYDYNNAQKGFDYLIKTIANRDGDIWPSRKLIHFQIFSDDGELIVNWINRNETLDCDLEKLAQFLGVNYRMKEKQRVGVKDDYRKYYNNELIDLVYQTWGREMKLFGFKFDKNDMETAILKRNINEDTGTRVKYYWDKDLLLLDEKEF